MKALIIGGGIGGLATALSLHAQGIACEVFEQNAKVRELGVGINVLPHAIKELTDLGLLDALDRIAIQTQELTYTTRLGQMVWHELRGLKAGYDYPQFSIHRGKLQKVLYDAAIERSIDVHTGHRFDGFIQDEDSVTATFDREGGSTEVTGDLLIGADGIHSVLRRQFYPDEGPAVWSGINLWRGALETDPWKTGNEMFIAGGDGARLVYYPISNDVAQPGKQLVNWAIGVRIGENGAPPPEAEDWNKLGKREELLARVKDVGFDLGDVDPIRLIEETKEIFEFPRCDRDPLPRWSYGRATLLGDAAHSMYPTGSNGASQAILDARSLARFLTAEASIPEALRLYQNDRRPPTAKIVRQNRFGGPEGVIDLVEKRAPNGFDNISDVATPDELQAVVKGYSSLAGFEKSQVNA